MNFRDSSGGWGGYGWLHCLHDWPLRLWTSDGRSNTGSVSLPLPPLPLQRLLLLLPLHMYEHQIYMSIAIAQLLLAS